MTTSRVNTASIALAIPLAGPIFIATTFVIQRAGIPGFETPGGVATAAVLIPLALLSAAFGSVLSILPCIFGTMLLARIGRGNVAMRLPVMWALVGGGLVAMPSVLIAGGSATVVTPLIATGAVCALICRRGVTWADDAPLSEPRSPAICTRHDT